MQIELTKTLKRQRAAMQVEPIHAQVGPVRAYAKQIAALKGEPFSVVTVPEGSAAYGMGYRFVSIPDSELPHYLANGATRTKDAA
jgi:hypothetical protein